MKGRAFAAWFVLRYQPFLSTEMRTLFARFHPFPLWGSCQFRPIAWMEATKKNASHRQKNLVLRDSFDILPVGRPRKFGHGYEIIYKMRIEARSVVVRQNFFSPWFVWKKY